MEGFAVSNRTSGDHPGDHTNREIEGQQNGIAGAADQTLPDADRTASRGDRRVGGGRAAGDRDSAWRAAPDVRVFGGDIRERSARQREHSARTRLNAAATSDAIAHGRDLAAQAREQAAAAREVRMTAPDAEHHAFAAEDRRAAADDREQAARERRLILADLDVLARQVAMIETDALTGARPRSAGLCDLDLELERCRRTNGLLVVVHVDVVAARALNDSQAHHAADALLTRVVENVHEHLRSHDLIIRLGAHELLCATTNMTLSATQERFSAIGAAIGAGAITTGFAALTSHETSAELIAHAGSDLLTARRAA